MTDATNNLSDADLRDYLLRCHELSRGMWVQDEKERLRRVGVLTEEAVQRDAIMRGFLGRGGPEAGRDILGGSASLAAGGGRAGEEMAALREVERVARGSMGVRGLKYGPMVDALAALDRARQARTGDD